MPIKFSQQLDHQCPCQKEEDVQQDKPHVAIDTIHTLQTPQPLQFLLTHAVFKQKEQQEGEQRDEGDKDESVHHRASQFGAG